jgi:pimeloyl-ACP methyl ester carboxylesterase
MNVTTIVLINGLWISALGWEMWAQHYLNKGYRVIAANWPGMNGDIEHLRRDPSSLASLGLTEVVDHYEQIIRELETPPIIIGYGFGALVTQILLDRGWGAAGVGIAPAPMPGLLRVLMPTLRAFLNAMLKGGKEYSEYSLTRSRFRRAFANTLTESESRAAFERYVVPGPNRTLLQAALAKFTPRSPTSVNFRNHARAPLLLVAGGKDRVAPPSLVKANSNLYRQSTAETDYKEYPNQSHFTLLQETKVADYVLGWAICRADSASTLAGFPNRKASWSVQLSPSQ